MFKLVFGHNEQVSWSEEIVVVRVPVGIYVGFDIYKRKYTGSHPEPYSGIELKQILDNINNGHLRRILVYDTEDEFFKLYPQIPYNPALRVNVYYGDMASFIMGSIITSDLF